MTETKKRTGRPVGRPKTPPLVKTLREPLNERKDALREELAKVATGEDFHMLESRIVEVGSVIEMIGKAPGSGEVWVKNLLVSLARRHAALNSDLVKEHREEYVARIDEAISELGLAEKQVRALLRKEGHKA